MASGIPLKSLATGVEWVQLISGGIGLGSSRLVRVYARGTTTPIATFSDQGLSVPLTQPLTTDATGGVPGYIAAEQQIDFLDVASGLRAQAEPFSVADIVGSDGKVGGAGSVGLPTSVVNVSPGAPYVSLDGPNVYDVVGHSYAEAAAGASSDMAGHVELFAKSIGAKRWANRAVNGAILCWAADTSVGQGNGGWAHAINAINDGAGAIFLQPEAGSGSGLANSYGPRRTIVETYYGINDLAQLGSNNLRPFLEALRTVWSHGCASKIWSALAGSPPWTFTGAGWANVGNGQAALYGSSKRTSTTTQTATLAIPSDVPAGRTWGITFVVRATDNIVATVAQNGSTIATLTLQGSAICDPNHSGATNPQNAFTYRFGEPGDGITVNPSDSIVVTLTTATAGGMEITSAQVEADPLDGPIILMPLPNHLASYATWNSYPFGPSAGTNPLNNASVDSMKAQILAGPATEFGNRVVTVDLDTGPVQLQASDIYSGDNTHPNNRGHARIAEAKLRAFRGSLLFTPRLATCAAPFPSIPFYKPANVHHILNAGWPSAVSFLNSFAEYISPGSPSTANGGTAAPYWYSGYRRDENGMVRMRGKVRTGASGTILLKLGPGYSPALITELPVACQGGVAGFATIQPTGAVAGGAAITLTFPSIAVTGTTDGTTNIITGISSTTGMTVGQELVGAGIPTGSTITSIDSGTQVHISNNTNAAHAGEAMVAQPAWIALDSIAYAAAL